MLAGLKKFFRSRPMVAILEDSATMAYMVSMAVKMMGGDPEVYETLEEFQRGYQSSDIYICDLTLPDSSSGETMEWIREHLTPSRTLIFSGSKTDCFGWRTVDKGMAGEIVEEVKKWMNLQ